MTRERMSEQELDATLADLGERLAYPRPTRLADAVSARLREPRAGRWWDALRSPRYAFAPVFATLAVFALVIVLALPGARAAASDFLHAWGIDIFRVPAIATPAVNPSPRSGLGVLTTLVEARVRAGFPVRAPRRITSCTRGGSTSSACRRSRRQPCVLHRAPASVR